VENVNMQYEYEFLLALLFTIIIETIVLFITIRKFFKIPNKKISNAFLIFLGIFTSGMTLPYLWFIFPIFLQNYIAYLIIGELIVFLLEAIIYFFILKLGIKKSLIISFFCNLFSLLFGLVLNKLFFNS